MKNTILLLLLFSNPVFSDIYKCIENGGTKYQSTPCSDGGRFHLGPDITIQQQYKAKAKLDYELAERSEHRRIYKEARDRERTIRAEEVKAYQSERHASEARRANNIEAERLRRKITAIKPVFH